MTDGEFWELIDETRRGHERDVEAHQEALVQRLAKLSSNERIDFQNHLYVHEREAFRADLWGAGFVINGGCSDDGFEYFIGWVISRGEKVFRAALADPDTLADIAEEDVKLERLYYAAAYAHERATGKDDFYDLLPRPPRKSLVGDCSIWAAEDDMDEDKCRKLFPRIWKRFCEE